MAFEHESVVCHERGSDARVTWSDLVDLEADDLHAVTELVRSGRLVLESEGKQYRIGGADYVGSVILPSSRRIHIRSKVDGLTLLRWFGFIHECPAIDSWVQEFGFQLGNSFPENLTGIFLKEMTRLTRGFLRKDYVREHTFGSTIRGRLQINEFFAKTQNFPRLPQMIRSRSLQTLHNRVLAVTLDRIAPLLLNASSDLRAEYALLRCQWSTVSRELSEANSAASEALLAIPYGYRSALQIAALILRRYDLFENTGTGGQTFLHRVSTLWERALRKMCERASANTEWNLVSSHLRTKSWDDAVLLENADRFLTVDIMLNRKDSRWVLDAKYKRGFGSEERGDRFQMCAYALAFKADRVTLVYPTAPDGTAPLRLLLSSKIGDQTIEIESLQLPMAEGPNACEQLLHKIFLASC